MPARRRLVRVSLILSAAALVFGLDEGARAATITANPGTTPQSTTLNQLFPTLLAATVKTDDGLSVPGILVTFTAPSSGPSGTFANNTNQTTALTNASGVATASTFMANGTLGSYTVTASCPNIIVVRSGDYSSASPLGPIPSISTSFLLTNGLPVGIPVLGSLGLTALIGLLAAAGALLLGTKRFGG